MEHQNSEKKILNEPIQKIPPIFKNDLKWPTFIATVKSLNHLQERVPEALF